MVVADVAREPLEDFWEFVVGAALEGCGYEVPFFFAFPVDAFELVLDVEEPDSYAGEYGADTEL